MCGIFKPRMASVTTELKMPWGGKFQHHVTRGVFDGKQMANNFALSFGGWAVCGGRFLATPARGGVWGVMVCNRG